MPNLDLNVTVSVSGDSPPVSAVNFGVVLVLSVADALGAGFTERYRAYTSTTAVATDLAAGDLDAATAAAVNAAFAQNPRVTTIAVGRVAAAEAEGTALAAILAENSNFYCVCPVTRTASNLEAVATWVESNDRIAILQSSDADLLTGAGTSIAKTLKDASRQRSAVLYHATDSQHANVAWAAKTLQADPDLKTTTWAYKTLSGITTAALTATQYGNLTSEGGNAYGTFGGLGSTYPGKMANGQWIDVQLTMDWVKARIRERTAQLLVNESNNNRKIPYDDGGIQQLVTEGKAILIQGVNADHFTRWTVTAPKRADVATSDVTARQYAYSFEAELSGAIQEGTITGYVVTQLSS